MAVLPALALIVRSASDERREAARQARQSTFRLAHLAAGAHSRLIDGARGVLATLAEVPAISDLDPDRCGEMLSDLIPRFPLYTNLGVADRRGDVVCSGLPVSEPISVADRTFFEEALRHRDFAIGEYQIGSTTGLPTLNFGYPIGRIDRRGPRGVVFAGLDLSWLNRLAAEVDLPAGAVLTVIDREGTVLARSEDPEQWVGRTLAGAPVVRTILARGQGTAEAVGLDGVRRLYGFTPLPGAPEGEAFASIGIPTEEALAAAGRTLRFNLLALGLVALLALAAAWVAGGTLVVRPVERLVGAARRLAAGDLTARVGPSYGSGEVAELGRTFDEMAGRLETLTRSLEREVEQRTMELAHANRRLEEHMERLREAYEKEQRAAASLRELDRMKTEFVAMIAHDLRSPIATISGFADLLREHWDRFDDSRKREFLDTMTRQVGSLSKLVEDVLQVARIESGQFSYDLRTYDLSALIRRTAEEVRGAHPDARIDIADEPGVPRAYGDPHRHWQVLTNLLSNAVKFSRARPDVRVELTHEDGMLRVSVRDRGIGIRPEDHARLFEKFSRISSRDTGTGSGGSGLGLYICRMLVEGQGGRIWVESAPEEGSTFSFTVATAEEAVGDGEAAAGGDGNAGASRSGTPGGEGAESGAGGDGGAAVR